MATRRKAYRAESGTLSARTIFAAGVALLFLAACGVREPGLAYENGVVRAEGWSGPEPEGGWQSVLVVRAGDDPSAPPLLGDYSENGGVITFTPRFEPSPGVALKVSFRPAAGSELTATFGEPAKAVASSTKVVGIHPSADAWPANTLRMYVEFSAPMAAGEAYERILVRDDQGRLIEGPFVEIDQELWDPSGTRLTVLFDPGRIKRGLVDNEASGPPLMPGRTVTIEIDPAWRDATGVSLAETFSRTIRVTEPLRDPIDPKAWTIAPPKSENDPLVIAFDRPLDHALALRTIQVTRDGSPVVGDASLEEQDTRLRFKPSTPWTRGGYTILVDGVLEDIAGNRPGKAFDVDTSDPAQSTSATPSTAIGFTFPPG